MAGIHRKTRGGVWYVTFYHNGERKHRSLGTRNYREALTKKAALEIQLAQRAIPSVAITPCTTTGRQSVSTEEFWAVFEPWARTHRSPRTVEEYHNWFTQFVDFSGIGTLEQATPAQAEAFKSRLLLQGKRTKRGKGLNPVSVNNGIKTLRSLWNHAARLELFSGVNPFSKTERFRIPSSPAKQYLDKEQIEALLSASSMYASRPYIKRIDAQNIRLAISLMAYAGLRKREVCFSRWEWIDWQKKILVVQSGHGFITKNRMHRTISMHENLIDMLYQYAEEDGFILKDIRPHTGKTEYRADFKKAFRSVCKIAGINATPHDLRHSFASRHAVAGTSLHVIAGWLGHSTTSVTERYAHFQTGYNEAANNI